MASTSAVPSRRQSGPLGATAPWMPSTWRSVGGDLLGLASPSTRISWGSSEPSPIPASSSAISPSSASPCLAIVLASDAAELQVGRGERQREDHRQRRRRRRASGGATTSCAQRVQARLALSSVRRCGQSSRGPSFARTTGSSVIADQRRDQRDQHPAVAHRAQERQRQRDQRQQADRDRDAAEDDGAPRGLHRPLDRLVVRCGRGRAPRASATRPAASSRSRRRGRSARSGTARSARRR